MTVDTLYLSLPTSLVYIGAQGTMRERKKTRLTSGDAHEHIHVSYFWKGDISSVNPSFVVLSTEIATSILRSQVERYDLLVSFWWEIRGS